jgi:hypothetical protein
MLGEEIIFWDSLYHRIPEECMPIGAAIYLETALLIGEKNC